MSCRFPQCDRLKPMSNFRNLFESSIFHNPQRFEKSHCGNVADFVYLLEGMQPVAWYLPSSIRWGNFLSCNSGKTRNLFDIDAKCVAAMARRQCGGTQGLPAFRRAIFQCGAAKSPEIFRVLPHIFCIVVSGGDIALIWSEMLIDMTSSEW